MKNKIRSYIVIFSSILILNFPFFVFAWSPGQPIVPPCDICGWNDLLQLVDNVISFALYLATVLAILSFMYAGFLMMTAQGKASQVDKAKGIFVNVVLGLVFAYGAWVLVYFILQALRVQGDFRKFI